MEKLEESKAEHSPCNEFLNFRYYQDKSYCEYEDWNEQISSKYHFKEIPAKGLSNMGKILVNQFCGESNKVSLMPILKQSEIIKKINIEFKLLKQEP